MEQALILEESSLGLRLLHCVDKAPSACSKNGGFDEGMTPPDYISIAPECPGIVEARHKKGLVDSVRKCFIHNTLLHVPKIRVDFVFPAVPNAA